MRSERSRRADLLHQIQRLLAERVEEPGLALIPAFPYSGPLEDVRLKK